MRFDPDAAWHVEGGGDRVWGLNFATASVRCDEGRFMLGAEHVENDEAAMALVLLARIRRYAPGAQSVVWDMALRGEHLQEILTVLGLVPVVQVHAKANPKRGKGRKKGEYVPKTADIDDITVVMPDGSKEIVHIAAKDGWACVKTLTDTGDPHYEPLTCTRIQPHKTKKRHRWYGFSRLPEEYGGIEICLRLDTTREDGRRGLNRTENLRAIPEGSKDFERLWALRPDSESINNSIEEALWKKKASAKGWRGQMVDLLGYERVRQRHHPRSRPGEAAAWISLRKLPARTDPLNKPGWTPPTAPSRAPESRWKPGPYHSDSLNRLTSRTGAGITCRITCQLRPRSSVDRAAVS